MQVFHTIFSLASPNYVMCPSPCHGGLTTSFCRCSYPLSPSFPTAEFTFGGVTALMLFLYFVSLVKWFCFFYYYNISKDLRYFSLQKKSLYLKYCFIDIYWSPLLAYTESDTITYLILVFANNVMFFKKKNLALIFIYAKNYNEFYFLLHPQQCFKEEELCFLKLGID